MAFIRKIKASLVRQDSSEYVGEDSYLFYDIETNCIRVADGITPGGLPACVENDWNNIRNKPSPTLTLSGDASGSTTFVELTSAELAVVIPDLDNKVDWSAVGQPDGVASLDSQGVVPESQLPDTFGNELVFDSLAGFVVPGNDNQLYVDTDQDRLYRWDGVGFVPIGSAAGTILEHSEPVQIPPPQTKTIFSFTTTGSTSTKFIIHASDKTDGRFMSCEILCSVNAINHTVAFTQYAITGDLIRLPVSMTYVGSTIELELTNNDSHPVIASATRIPTIVV